MSFEVDGLVAVLFFVPLIGVFFAFATMPRWCVKSISRHRLWRLRDRVVDDIIAKELPADHGAVQDLLKVIEWRIEHHRSLDLLHAMVWWGANTKVPASVQKQYRREISLDDLTEEQAERISAYREQCISIIIIAMMMGSWIGIASVLPAITVAVVSDSRKDRRPAAVAQEAVNSSRPGRFFRERIRNDECAPIHAGVA